jgi:hypothetical protein
MQIKLQVKEKAAQVITLVRCPSIFLEVERLCPTFFEY